MTEETQEGPLITDADLDRWAQQVQYLSDTKSWIIGRLVDEVRRLRAEREWRPMESMPEGKPALVCGGCAGYGVGVGERFGNDICCDDDQAPIDHFAGWMPLPE